MKEIQLSCDGIQENKSNSISIDAYSLKFKKCKSIYPHKLVRPLSKQACDHNRHLNEVIKDINDNLCRILQFVGDNPKRAFAKAFKNHASWYACDYCFSKGVKIVLSNNVKAEKQIIQQKQLIEEKIRECQNNQPTTPETEAKIGDLIALKNNLQKSANALRKKSNILWPFSTMRSEHRSRKSVLDTVSRIENGEELSIDEAKGIVGKSVLLDIPNFNFIYDVPAEYMHTGCLGVVKRLVILTFNVGENRKRLTTRKLSSVKDFNELMLKTKVTKEFPRRARKLDVGVFKALEYRNLVIFFFPHVLQCIEPDAKERDLWLYIAYMFRSCLLPSNEFSPLDLNVIRECCTKFYEIFEQLFGNTNCPYNLHVFCSHLLEIRTHGPLTETSAFKFESFYGEVRRSFVSGTISPLKQIMKKIFLKRALTNHVCQNNIYISNYETPMESNNLCYVYVRNEYFIYKIEEIDGDMATCHKVGQYPATFPQTSNINWAKVGVFKKGGVSSEITSLQTSEICGKVIIVGDYLITCPTNVLNEK